VRRAWHGTAPECHGTGMPRHGTGMPRHGMAPAATARHVRSKLGLYENRARRTRFSCALSRRERARFSSTVDARGGSGSACTEVEDAGAAEVGVHASPVDAHGGGDGSASTSLVHARQGRAAAGRRARKSWTLDTGAAEVGVHEPRGRAAAAAGRRARKSWTLEPRRSACTEVVDAGAAEVGMHEPRGRARQRRRIGVHGSRGRWCVGRVGRLRGRRRPAVGPRRATPLVGVRSCWSAPPGRWPARCDGAEGPGVGRRAELLVGDAGPLARAVRRRRGARALAGARSCWSATPGRWSARCDGAEGPGVGRRAELLVGDARWPGGATVPGPGRWSTRGAVGRRRPLARAVRRCQGPGCWPARGAVGRRRRAVGPRGATAPRARALAGARSCWSATPAVGPRGATVPRARALAGARSCWSATPGRWPAVRRRRGPERWPARGAVGLRHRPLARAVRRCRGLGRWSATPSSWTTATPSAGRWLARCDGAEGPGVGRRAELLVGEDDSWATSAGGRRYRGGRPLLGAVLVLLVVVVLLARRRSHGPLQQAVDGGRIRHDASVNITINVNPKPAACRGEVRRRCCSPRP
jgi:hypothetical protein